MSHEAIVPEFIILDQGSTPSEKQLARETVKADEGGYLVSCPPSESYYSSAGTQRGGEPKIALAQTCRDFANF